MRQTITEYATFPRRIGAILYDTFIIIALLIFACTVIVIYQHGPVANPQGWFRYYLVSIWAVFFIFFWYRYQQTLGMLAWRLQLQSSDGTRPQIKQVLLRLLFAIPAYLLFGIGIWWALFDKEKRGLHERLSGTRLVYTGGSRRSP